MNPFKALMRYMQRMSVVELLIVLICCLVMLIALLGILYERLGY